MLEFLFDTTRAVVNLVLNGTVARHPNIAFIVPHAGATLPVIADRVTAFALVLAGFPLPRQLDALLTITTLDHLHYGSDYPFTPDSVVDMLVAQLGDAGTPAGSLSEALSDNTRRLFTAVAKRFADEHNDACAADDHSNRPPRHADLTCP